MHHSTQHAGLQNLDALVGTWDVTATIDGEDMGSSQTRFFWMDGESFLVERMGDDSPPSVAESDWAANAPDSVTMIIGLDDTNERYSALYADARDVFRVYQMTLSDGVWTLWRDAPGFSQRFRGTFSEDGNTISGRWEASSDGEHWEYDFDLTYTKVTGEG